MDPVLDTTLRITLALLFVTAAAHKVRDVGRFRATVAAYRLLPERLSPVVAGLLIGAEAVAAVSLVTPTLRVPGLVAAAALLLLYGAAVGINLARGRDIDCGCAGPALRRPINAALVARNSVLAAMALAGLGPVHARPLVWVDVLTVAGATAALAALYAALDRLMAHAPVLARLRGDA